MSALETRGTNKEDLYLHTKPTTGATPLVVFFNSQRTKDLPFFVLDEKLFCLKRGEDDIKRMEAA